MLLEYQLDWIKIVDFSSTAKFWASPNNLYPPSSGKEEGTKTTKRGKKAYIHNRYRSRKPIGSKYKQQTF